MKKLAAQTVVLNVHYTSDTTQSSRKADKAVLCDTILRTWCQAFGFDLKTEEALVYDSPLDECDGRKSYDYRYTLSLHVSSIHSLPAAIKSLEGFVDLMHYELDQNCSLEW